MRYEQQGCYSPQMLFVERGGRSRLANSPAIVAHELASFAQKHPRRALSMAEATGLANWRSSEELRAFGDGAA
jgi:hypothetical protein